METHKPKIWHGSGEFFREYLIIVVGVVTELGDEQAVEWMHRQRELAETREALREEIARNGALIILGAAMDHCRSGMIEKYQSWARGRSPQPDNPPVAVPVLSFSVWDVAKAGPLSRMPVNERLSYSSVYDHFIVHTKNSEREVELGLALAQYVNQKTGPRFGGVSFSLLILDDRIGPSGLSIGMQAALRDRSERLT